MFVCLGLETQDGSKSEFNYHGRLEMRYEKLEHSVLKALACWNPKRPNTFKQV